MICPLTEKQAKQLAYIQRSAVRYLILPRRGTTRHELLVKDCIVPGEDGVWFLSKTGADSLAAYLADHGPLWDSEVVE